MQHRCQEPSSQPFRRIRSVGRERGDHDRRSDRADMRAAR